MYLSLLLLDLIFLHPGCVEGMNSVGCDVVLVASLLFSQTHKQLVVVSCISCALHRRHVCVWRPRGPEGLSALRYRSRRLVGRRSHLGEGGREGGSDIVAGSSPAFSLNCHLSLSYLCVYVEIDGSIYLLRMPALTSLHSCA